MMCGGVLATSITAISGQVEPGDLGKLVQDDEWTGRDARGVQDNLISMTLGPD